MPQPRVSVTRHRMRKNSELEVQHHTMNTVERHGGTGGGNQRFTAIAFLFLFGVFFASARYDLSYCAHPVGDPNGGAAAIEGGDAIRRAALASLSGAAVLSLLRKRRQQLRVNGPIGLLIPFYLFWASASIGWADEPSLAARRVTILLFLSVGALAVAERFSLPDIVYLTFFICGVILLMSVCAELLLGTFSPADPAWRFGGIMDAVAQGWNCGLLAISAVALATMRKRHRGLLLLIAVAATLFMAMTRSRMAFATAILGVAVYLSLLSFKSRRLVIISGYLGVGCLGACYLLGLLSSVTSLGNLGRGQEGAATIGTLTGRVPLWEECLRYAAERPLTGYGYDSFLTPAHFTQIGSIIGWQPATLHSGYFETLLGVGLVGATTFVIILVLAVKSAVSASQRHNSYAFAAAVLSWLFGNLFTEAYLLVGPIFPAFLCIVLVAKLAYVQNPAAARPPSEPAPRSLKYRQLASIR